LIILSAPTTTPNTAIFLGDLSGHHHSSTLDPSMAPPGKHVMSIFVQYAPYHLKNGTWPERREALGDTVIDT